MTISLTVAIALITAISGIVLGWAAKERNLKHDVAAEASQDAEIRTDIQYIKHSIDEVRLDQKDQSRRYNELSERVTRVEEDTKNAHRRINRMEGEGK